MTALGIADLRRKYPFVAGWIDYTGSSVEYLEMRLRQAEEDGAPRRALYRRSDGTWATVEGLSNGDAESRLQRAVGIRAWHLARAGSDDFVVNPMGAD